MSHWFFQDVVNNLIEYWVGLGCNVVYGYDIEVGAGTFNPMTFFKVLEEGEWRVVYVEPSRRPEDARYGQNPNRLYQHHQLQVILQPAPKNSQQIYLDSLRAVGLELDEHDVSFVEDDWESETLGAVGVGWEVRLDGLEITQFTYFQQIGGISLKVVPLELTYGLERITMYLQKKNVVFDIMWSKQIDYGQLRKRFEYEHSKYSFECIDVGRHELLFRESEAEAVRLLSLDLVLVAYEYVLKCSHIFNLLAAAGALSVQARSRYIARIRNLANACAKKYKSQL